MNSTEFARAVITGSERQAANAFDRMLTDIRENVEATAIVAFSRYTKAREEYDRAKAEAEEMREIVRRFEQSVNNKTTEKKEN